MPAQDYRIWFTSGDKQAGTSERTNSYWDIVPTVCVIQTQCHRSEIYHGYMACTPGIMFKIKPRDNILTTEQRKKRVNAINIQCKKK